MRLLPILPLAVLIGGCAPSGSRICAYVEGQGCDSCLDGEVTCTFDGMSRTKPSCGGCQAELSLYLALCEANSTASVEEIQDGMVCEEIEPGT